MVCEICDISYCNFVISHAGKLCQRGAVQAKHNQIFMFVDLCTVVSGLESSQD